MSDGGWHPVWRKLYDTDHWLAPTKRDPSNRRDAWNDLCQMATHQPRKVRDHVLGRGELIASVRTLGDRWKWSKSRVERFMSDLEARTSIETVCGTPDGTVYRVVNYDDYAVLATPKRDSERDSKRDTSGTAAGQEQEQKHSNNNSLSDFEEVWLLSKRGSKKKALDQYRKAVPSKVSHPDLLAAQRAHVAAARSSEYVAHLWRWIRDERWEEAQPSANGSGPHWADAL